METFNMLKKTVEYIIRTQLVCGVTQLFLGRCNKHILLTTDLLTDLLTWEDHERLLYRYHQCPPW